VFRLANLAEQRGDWEQYRSLIEGLLRHNPLNAPCWGYLATVQEQTEDKSTAIASLEKAVSIDRDYDWGWEELSRLYADQGCPERLMSRLRRDCRRFPGDIGVYWRAARHCADGGEALHLLLKARELDVLNPTCHTKVIRQLIDMGRHLDARAAIDHPAWQGPPPALVLSLEAEITRAQGQRTIARQQLRAVLESAPELISSWRTLSFKSASASELTLSSKGRSGQSVGALGFCGCADAVSTELLISGAKSVAA